MTVDMIHDGDHECTYMMMIMKRSYPMSASPGTALITGASTGIGAALARVFAAQGAVQQTKVG